MPFLAFLDCFSGISGDMFLGALVDAGLPFGDLEDMVSSLGVAVSLKARKEARHGIFGTRLEVKTDTREYVPRNLDAIKDIISKAPLTEKTKERSIEVFTLLAESEARIHGYEIDEVHFHEVGAWDSIVDVVGVVFGLERLGLDRIFSSPLPLGRGFVDTAHGRIPVPSPATIDIVRGIPVLDSGVCAEMVTPTGAALVKVVAEGFGEIPPMRVKGVGYGVGARDLPDRPNLLRILLGEDTEGLDTETVVLMDTNVDDCSPEILGYLMERLFDSGALDVTFVPAGMKKGRIGVCIKVIAHPKDRDTLMDILFRETTTTGVRFSYKSRRILKRYSREIESPWGKISVKEIHSMDGKKSLTPEYDTCRRLALEKGIPLKDIYAWVQTMNQ